MMLDDLLRKPLHFLYRLFDIVVLNSTMVDAGIFTLFLAHITKVTNRVSNHIFFFTDKNPLGNPFRQGKKGEKNVPVKTAMVAQNAENGNFSKLTYAPQGYLEATRYLATQPLASRKNGFGKLCLSLLPLLS